MRDFGADQLLVPPAGGVAAFDQLREFRILDILDQFLRLRRENDIPRTGDVLKGFYLAPGLIARDRVLLVVPCMVEKCFS